MAFFHVETFKWVEGSISTNLSCTDCYGTANSPQRHEGNFSWRTIIWYTWWASQNDDSFCIVDSLLIFEWSWVLTKFSLPSLMSGSHFLPYSHFSNSNKCEAFFMMMIVEWNHHSIHRRVLQQIIHHQCMYRLIGW